MAARVCRFAAAEGKAMETMDRGSGRGRADWQDSAGVAAFGLVRGDGVPGGSLAGVAGDQGRGDEVVCGNCNTFAEARGGSRRGQCVWGESNSGIGAVSSGLGAGES